MKRIIDELFKKVKSQDKKISSNAVTALSFILEIHAWNIPKEDRMSRYSLFVPQEVVEAELDESEQAEVVKFLSDEIENGSELTAGLLFAMGQSSAKVGLLPLIHIIEQCLEKFNQNEVYQALVALERIMFFDESIPLESLRQIIAETNLLNVISAKILSLQVISHSGLQSTSLRLLARLILLLNNSTEVIE
jgi:hypothetical protein